eukprot:Hpha_TRINITY_DN18017_c0_g1::TRINITY_DN18017_c0_g1_i1::g.1222::m.1222
MRLSLTQQQRAAWQASRRVRRRGPFHRASSSALGDVPRCSVNMRSSPPDSMAGRGMALWPQVVLILFVAAAAAQPPRYTGYRLVITAAREGSRASVGDLRLRRGGVELDARGAVDGDPNRLAAVDRNPATHWSAELFTPLNLTFQAGAEVDQYGLVTPLHALPREDPMRWRLEGSLGGGEWDVLDEYSEANFPTPLLRGAFTGWLRAENGTGSRRSSVRLGDGVDIDPPEPTLEEAFSLILWGPGPFSPGEDAVRVCTANAGWRAPVRELQTRGAEVLRDSAELEVGLLVRDVAPLGRGGYFSVWFRASNGADRLTYDPMTGVSEEAEDAGWVRVGALRVRCAVVCRSLTAADG